MTCSDQFAAWFSTRRGQHMLLQEQVVLSGILSRCFGHYALQVSPVPRSIPAFSAITRCYTLQASLFSLGSKVSGNSTQLYPSNPLNNLPLNTNPLQHDALPSDTLPDTILVDLLNLPFESASINAVLLHHTLDLCEHPHRLLREIDRVLVPGGRLILVGFNPWSFWGLAGRMVQGLGQLVPSTCLSEAGLRLGCPYLPCSNRYLSVSRLKDWLQLLNFEVDDLHMLSLNKGLGWWPLSRVYRFTGIVYVLSGVKRTSCLTPIRPGWMASAQHFRPVPLPL